MCYTLLKSKNNLPTERVNMDEKNNVTEELNLNFLKFSHSN